MPAEEYAEATTHRLEDAVVRRTPGLSTDDIVDKLMLVGERLTGKKPYPYQIPFIRRLLEVILEREAEEVTALWARQCIGGDEIVLDRDGSAYRMSCAPGSFQTGIKPTYRLVASGGYSLNHVTLEHVFFDEYGDERPLSDFKVGDRIQVVRWTRTRYTEDHAAQALIKAMDPLGLTSFIGEDGEHIDHETVLSIEPTGVTMPVYDRKVPGKEWFYCQGFRAHNSGKSESLGFAASTLLVMLPALSKAFPNDDRFCFYDSQSGITRDYTGGFWIGVYAPKKEQAGIIFNRIRNILKRRETIEVLAELGITYETNNGDTFRLSNGSFVKCSTASDQANIEGSTLHLAIMEESQDISDQKANKSIGPMLASTGGSIVKIGTANARKSHFYLAIKRNERRHAQGGNRNHFLVRWEAAAACNSFYANFVRKEAMRLGETSDEFRMNYEAEFLLERGVAIPERLFNSLTVTEGVGSDILPGRRPGLSYVAGIDFGKIHDSTVVTVIEVDWYNPRQIVSGFDPDQGSFTVEIYGKHIVDWMECQGDDYEAQYVEIRKFLSKWGVERIALDYTGVGTSLGDRFKALYDNVDVEFVTYSDDSKDSLGRQLIADLHTGMLTWPGGEDCSQRRVFRNFKSQMLDVEKDYRNGLLNLHHPDIAGAHDDYVQSTSLAVRAANTKPFGGTIEDSPGFMFR